MSRTINFVRERQRNLTRLEEQDRQIFRWLLVGVGVLMGLVFIAVGVRLFFLYRMQVVTDQQANLKQAIVAQEEVERSFTVFAHKLKTLTELFGRRKEKQETLAYFSTLFDENVVIRQLSYTAETEELSFILESKNIFVLEGVFETMNSQEIKDRFPTIRKESLRRGPDGSYGMYISILLGDKMMNPDDPDNAVPADGSVPVEEVPAIPGDTSGSTP